MLETLNGCNPSDKFAAALCLSKIGGIYNNKIIEVLVENYFDAKEQYTREQTVRSLAYLSDNFVIISLISRIELKFSILFFFNTKKN